jgi:SpoVK/Ycf46/Vps4 family AAA+-type ATPase
MEWDDLVLPGYTLSQLFEIETWLKYHSVLMNEWGMIRKLKPGFKTLFHGPPGTGKTLTAALLGKKTGTDVFRIDLSKIVSKYIGETEKNLAKVFDRAENKNWILFFDEADALFGKRTNINDAHDRYANQEVAYLLQRIEDYDGLVILASNFKSNIDVAFMRRFQSMIHFPLPNPDERLLLWENGFSEKCTLEEKIDLHKIANDFEMAGGSIINVIHFSSLMALSRDSSIILQKDILEGIKREFAKKGMTI